MPRYALLVEYHGTPFAGWQRQADQPSVQGAIEAALAKLEPGPHTIAAAGRTDAGVHAIGQVAHCDLSQDWDPFRLSEALNYHLKPLPIAILKAARVAPEWHARFSAHERRYSYRIIARRAPLTSDAGRAWLVKHPLDPTAMRAAAKRLEGLHDFTTFRAALCQAKSPVKTLDETDVVFQEAPGGQEYRFTFRARSFLHNQVRSMVGSLERVGTGAWSLEMFQAALDAADRTRCGPVAPPDGLTLTGVGYHDAPF